MNESQTDEPPRRRKPYQWALLALGPIVLVVIITMLDVEALWNTLRSVDIGMFVLAGFILCSTVFIRTWRWRMLLADLTHEVPPYRDLVLIFAYATYVGVATPGRLGEFVKAFHLRSYGVSMGAATATVLTDRLLDIIVLLLVALTAVILVAVPGAQTSVVVPVIIVAVVASLVFAWWLLRSPALDRLVRAAARVEHPRLRGVLERLAEFGRDFRAAIRMQAVSTLGIAIVLTVIGWAVVYGANWLIAESIGLGLTYVQVVVVSAVSSVAAQLPVTVLGVGTRDAVAIVVLATYGVGQEGAVALSTLFLASILFVALACAPSAFSAPVRFARKQTSDVES